MDEQYIKQIRIFHYATRLPVTLYSEGKIIYRRPAEQDCVMKLLFERDMMDGIQSSENQLLTPQYLSNEYGEHYIYFQLDKNHALLTGPFLRGTYREDDVRAMIRKTHPSLCHREKLQEHFCGLQPLSDNSIFYSGRMLECLFADSVAKPAEEFSVKPQNIPTAYFQNTYDNRIRLFSHPPYFLEQEICRLISSGDSEYAVRILSEINTQSRARLADDPLRSLKNSLICSCTLFTRAAISGGVSPDAAYTMSDSFIQIIEGIDSIRTLSGMEEQMINSFAGMVNDLMHERFSAVIRNAIRYIDSNLSEKISVNEIAKAVFVHPNYLSSLFKKEMGIPLSGFIRQRRIEEAKNFIRFSNSTIAEIANFYQFSSQSHFIKVFRQITGITPMNYRNNSDSLSVKG
ncbi:MAG: Transposon Tn10 TetD protein [Firmicutes bacterium ADurb.Bin182]|nr:MAG: Transposon Tn10 TetD protein [Firmicutes bacterium ADurb.Bin182]